MWESVIFFLHVEVQLKGASQMAGSAEGLGTICITHPGALIVTEPHTVIHKWSQALNLTSRPGSKYPYLLSHFAAPKVIFFKECFIGNNSQFMEDLEGEVVWMRIAPLGSYV